MTADIEIVKILADLGGTVLITVLLLYFGYKIFNRFGTAFIRTQQQIAEAMGRQAQNMADMKDTVHEFVVKDNSEHREILLGLQVVANELKTLSSRVKSS